MQSNSPQKWSDERFKPGHTPGLPDREKLLSWYTLEVDAARAAMAQALAQDSWADPFPSAVRRRRSRTQERPSYSPTTQGVAWGMAFMAFRSAAVCQGIAARIAARQASSARAAEYAKDRGALADFAWEMVKPQSPMRLESGGI